jgi:hypothetical protein
MNLLLVGFTKALFYGIEQSALCLGKILRPLPRASLGGLVDDFPALIDVDRSATGARMAVPVVFWRFHPTRGRVADAYQ